MKPFFRTALLLGIATLVLAEIQEAFAQGQSASQNVSTFAAKLEEIMSRPEFIHSEFGIALYDLDQRETIFALNANKLFTPASTTKLLTAGTALALLGASHRFHTPVYRTGLVKNGTLEGDLVLVASGDPNLSGRIESGDTLAYTNHDHAYGGAPATKAVPSDPLFAIRKLAGQVAASGIRRINGRVMVDATLFPQGDRESGTEVVISPIIVNDNVIDVTITPGAKEGDPAIIQISPEIGYLRIVNEVTTGAPGSNPDVQRPRDVVDANGIHTVTCSGMFPHSAPPILYAYQIPDPAWFAEMAFMFALRERGIEAKLRAVNEQPDFQRIAAAYTEQNRVAEHVSLPLSEALGVNLKVSQNLHAASIPYLLGAVRGGKHGAEALQAGFDLKREFLQQAGIDLSGASQGDGAGGALGAFFTPAFVVQYLAYMATRPDYSIFVRALPILGRDGSLWNIQPESPAAGKVFAKTGTFNADDLLNRRVMVTSKALAGYMTKASGQRLAFAIYVNRVPRPLDAPGGPALWVGQVVGEIAAAAYSF